MLRWRLLLGGPLIWAAHFGATYAVVSVSHQVTGATSQVARVVAVGVTLLCLGACAWVLASALRRSHSDPLDAFWRTIAAAGAILAAIAIVWQTLPTLAPLDGTAPASVIGFVNWVTGARLF